MRSWLLPSNSAARVSLPAGPSKTYFFSTFTHGNSRRCRFNWSRNFENFFSFARSCLRAASHSFWVTTLRFSIPRTVLIFGIRFSLVVMVAVLDVLSGGGRDRDLLLQFLQET